MWGDWGILASGRAYLVNSRTSMWIIAAVQETHFTCVEDYRVLRDDLDVFLVFGPTPCPSTRISPGKPVFHRASDSPDRVSLDPHFEDVGSRCGQQLEVQYLFTGNTGFLGAAGDLKSAGASRGGYRE